MPTCAADVCGETSRFLPLLRLACRARRAMGSAASAHSRYPASATEAVVESPLEIEKWGVERVAEYLDGDAECSAAAAYARSHTIDGAAALKMDEATLTKIAGVTVTRRLHWSFSTPPNCIPRRKKSKETTMRAMQPQMQRRKAISPTHLIRVISRPALFTQRVLFCWRE